MKFNIFEDEEGFLTLVLSGSIDYSFMSTCFESAKNELENNFYLGLIIDAGNVTELNISRDDCQELAPILFNFPRPVVFFSSLPLVFGVARVIHAYSLNDQFSVVKNIDQARQFLKLKCEPEEQSKN